MTHNPPEFLTMGINGELPYYRVKEILNGIDADIRNYSTIVNLETNNLNGIYTIEQYLKNDSLVLDRKAAFECNILTKM